MVWKSMYTLYVVTLLMVLEIKQYIKYDAILALVSGVL